MGIFLQNSFFLLKTISNHWNKNDTINATTYSAWTSRHRLSNGLFLVIIKLWKIIVFFFFVFIQDDCILCLPRICSIFILVSAMQSNLIKLLGPTSEKEKTENQFSNAVFEPRLRLSYFSTSLEISSRSCLVLPKCFCSKVSVNETSQQGFESILIRTEFTGFVFGLKKNKIENHQFCFRTFSVIQYSMDRS